MCKKLTNVCFFFIIIININGQPSSLFRPFDWVLYKGAGSITSITEGYTFSYIGTNTGGIKRFNLFGNYFDDPITTAQGLKSNNVSALHFDKKTGLLWVATKRYIHYSFSREGDWFPIKLNNLGLSNKDKIKRIGSSNQYIWLEAHSSYVKMEHSSGTLIGIYSIPDELEIQWSSGHYRGEPELKKIFLNYNILDGWSFIGNELLDNLGKRSDITTGFIGNHGNVIFGSSDGKIFHGTTTMETFYPIQSDLDNNDVTALFNGNDELWIGSSDYFISKGITKLNKKYNTSIHYTFEETINMNPTSIYSLFSFGDELWAGGNSLILYFDSNGEFWRTLGQESGVPSGTIFDLFGDETHVWIGSSKGLSRIERSTLREDQLGIEQYFSNLSVYDIESINNNIWLGTSMGLFIYSKNNPNILSYSNIGRKNFPQELRHVSIIKQYDDLIYLVSEFGIIRFDIQSKEWDMIFTSDIYHDKTVLSMEVNKKYLFLGLEDGLVRINKKTGLIRDYNYPFIGQVNEVALDEKDLWLGTSNGLVKFKWKRNL